MERCALNQPYKDRLVPTQLAALAAGVTEATIRKWASRGKIKRYGSPGRAQYDIDELLDLVAQPYVLSGGGQVGSAQHMSSARLRRRTSVAKPDMQHYELFATIFPKFRSRSAVKSRFSSVVSA